MAAKVKAEWLSGLRFEGTDPDGQTLEMAPPPDEGKRDGLVPMEMLLLGMAGCTGMDVMHVLEKKRQKPDGLKVEITGEKREKVPYTWETIHVKYIIKGDVAKGAVEHAIGLSMEKYCSCGIMLGATAKITSEYVIEQSQ
jgi:putative redox protein